MRFLVDDQLPSALARLLAQLGHEAEHVFEIGLDEAADVDIWRRCVETGAGPISKDEDFAYLANRPGDTGRLIWVRMGNCRRQPLLDAFERAAPLIESTLASGQRIVELVE